MKIDHVNIVCRDIEETARFYEELFGLTRGFSAELQGAWIESVTDLEGVHARCLFLEAQPGGTRIELIQYFRPQGSGEVRTGVPNTPGLRHLAFEVENMEALCARLDALGVQPISPPVEVPFSVGTLGRKQLMYFRDPNGTLVEAAAYQGR